ncbi:unnamed protein product [Mytilus coruscus]|uniref:Uncharacterized protein n=1 Tax=Mytilus coruscus TaxID=42192 RepID=A0A6J8F1V7_MYTCO|nr:unnamed protein product [Mytilus coruscus]
MSAMLAEFPPMVIGGSIISAVSLIVHVIGFSTTYWYRVGVAHMGLWKSCGEVKGAELCFDIKDAPVHYNQLVAAQVLECLALVAFVAAVTCAFLKMFVLKEQGMLFVVTGLLNWLADAPVHYNQLVAAQVLECLALVAFVAAVTCAFLKMFVLKEQGMLFVVTGLLNWLAGKY